MKNLIKNYKKRICTTWSGAILHLIIFNNPARLVFFILLAIIGSIITHAFNNDALLFKILTLTGILYSFGYTIIVTIIAIKNYFNELIKKALN
jgi:hypothetical protein